MLLDEKRDSVSFMLSNGEWVLCEIPLSVPFEVRVKAMEQLADALDDSMDDPLPTKGIMAKLIGMFSKDG